MARPNKYMPLYALHKWAKTYFISNERAIHLHLMITLNDHLHTVMNFSPFNNILKVFSFLQVKMK